MSNAIYPLAIRGLTWPIMKTHNFASIVQRAPSAYEVRIAQEQNPTWDFTLIYDYLKDNPADLVGSLSPYTDYQVMRGFLLARQGQFDDFLFNDIADNTVTNGTQPLVSDGAGSFYSPLQRGFANLFYEDVTDLNPLNGSGLTLKLNATSALGYVFAGPGLAIPGYSFAGMYVAWAWRAIHAYATNSTIVDPAGHLQKVTGGGGGNSGATIPTFNDSGGTTTDGALTWTDLGLVTTVTASFNFYFRVRLAMDSQDIEQFMTKLWTIGGSKSKNGSGTLKFTTARPIAA